VRGLKFTNWAIPTINVDDSPPSAALEDLFIAVGCPDWEAYKDLTKRELHRRLRALLEDMP